MQKKHKKAYFSYINNYSLWTKGKIIERLPALKSGFIYGGEGEDIFFSLVSEFVGHVYEDLRVGQYVVFDVVKTMRGPSAKCVQIEPKLLA